MSEEFEDSQVDSEELETNESEKEEYENEEESEGASDDESGADDEEEDDGNEDLEFNQKSYRVPKDIAEAVKSMQKDYTQKTMSLADQRKAHEAQVQFEREFQKDVGKVYALNTQLEEYSKVDWNKLTDEDPVLWQKLMSQRQALEMQRQQLVAELSHKQQEATLQRQQETAKLIEASESELKRDIKDWSPQRAAEIREFAKSKFGFSEAELDGVKADPRIWKLFNLAFQGSKVISKPSAKPKVVPLASPVTTLKTKGAKSHKNPADMSQAEYAKWRKSYR